MAWWSKSCALGGQLHLYVGSSPRCTNYSVLGTSEHLWASVSPSDNDYVWLNIG